MSEERKVVDLSNEELEGIGLFGDGASEAVKETIRVLRRVPDYLKWLTVYQLSCHNVHAIHCFDVPASPTSSTSTDATTRSQLSGSTSVEPDLVAPFEKVHFYHGISDLPPELLYRSDLQANPFVIPKGRHTALPVKTAHGVFDPVLTPIWRSTVGPAIASLLEEEQRGIRPSVLKTARFSTPDEDGKPVFGPITIWIAVHPGSTTPSACRDASPDILSILESHKVKGAVVHWYEGSVQPLVGPPLLRVTNDTDPTFWIRRALTAVLSMPLAAQEMEFEDAQGSLAFYFHEGQDKKGRPSNKLYGVTNKHVLSKVTNTDYELGRAGAAKKFIRVCGTRRFQVVVNETRTLISKKVEDGKKLAEQIEDLLARPPAEDEEEEEDNAEALQKKERELQDVERDAEKLEKFSKELNANWSDMYQRTIGWVDWAPKIRNDIDARRHTLDVGTFEVDKSKFQKVFKGNFVNLGGRYDSNDINTMFYPNAANPPSFKYPNKDHLLRILGFVTRERLFDPDFYDEQGNPTFIVAKDGQATDLTFGRFSSMEACRWDEYKEKSWEVCVYNYGGMGNFSTHGDSGSLIFNAEGNMVAILHSGMPRQFSNHVTFGTPAYFVIEQIKLRYPHADFSRLVL